MSEITIELFGIPRQRAGMAQVTVQARTLADALGQLEASCPRLAGLVHADGTLSPHYLLSLNGEHFVGDLREKLPAKARLLLLSADAGG
jgi:molybdopterin converting factor small subunit